jgi:hypothetical protein
MEQERQEFEALLAQAKVGRDGSLILTDGTVLKRNWRGEYVLSGPTAERMKAAGWCDGCAVRKTQEAGGWLAKQKLASVGIGKKAFSTVGHGHSH